MDQTSLSVMSRLIALYHGRRYPSEFTFQLPTIRALITGIHSLTKKNYELSFGFTVVGQLKDRAFLKL